MTIRNAWNQIIEPVVDPDDPWTVPEDQRVDHDDDPDADAIAPGLGDEEGDDLDGWQVGDPV